MRHVALLDNPASGQHSAGRAAVVRNMLAAFQAEGVKAEHLVIDGPGSGVQLAQAAIARGCDTIIVCGGDGTVHEVLQCLAGTTIALGVVPLGTANALAADLGLNGSPEKTLRALLAANRVQVPLGKIYFHDAHGTEHSRYFTVAAGVGADALLMSRLDAGLKRRFGYALYMIEAFRIWVTHSFPLFEARFKVNGTDATRTVMLSQLLAVRVRSFGGVLQELAPGATLHGQSLCLLAFKTRSRLDYFRFLMAVIFHRHTFARQIELIETQAVECHAGSDAHGPMFVEADGDVLGQLPARLEVSAQTLTLLIPPHARP
jgi:diacylglycerol kinase family enzyme